MQSPNAKLSLIRTESDYDATQRRIHDGLPSTMEVSAYTDALVIQILLKKLTGKIIKRLESSKSCPSS